MGTAIILVIILAILIFALKGSLKHVNGQGGCCGGSDAPKRKKKKLSGTIIATKTIKIDGMHCDACKQRIERTLNSIEGVSSKVNLKKKEAVIQMDRMVDDELLLNAIQTAGYQVISDIHS